MIHAKGDWFYALICVVLPLAWGLLMVAVIQGLERVAPRRSPERTKAEQSDASLSGTSPEYHI